jgi:hypothetical protein
MTGVIATLPKFQFSNALGLPMSGGTLTSYLAGTTTPATTYQDQALTTANTNPISLDSRGECTLWLDSTKTYKFVLKNALGAVQWTVDNITNASSFADQLRADLAAPSGASLVGYMPEGVGAVAGDVESAIRLRARDVLEYGAVEGADVSLVIETMLNNGINVITTGGRNYTWATECNINDTDNVVLDYSGSVISVTNKEISLHIVDGCKDFLLRGGLFKGAWPIESGDVAPSNNRLANGVVMAYDCPRIKVKNLRAESLRIGDLNVCNGFLVEGISGDALIDAADYWPITGAVGSGFANGIHFRACNAGILNNFDLRNYRSDGVKVAATSSDYPPSPVTSIYGEWIIITNGYLEGMVNDDAIDTYNSGTNVLISNILAKNCRKFANIKDEGTETAFVGETIITNFIFDGGLWNPYSASYQLGINASVPNLKISHGIIKNVDGIGLNIDGPVSGVNIDGVFSDLTIINTSVVSGSADSGNAIRIADTNATCKISNCYIKTAGLYGILIGTGAPLPDINNVTIEDAFDRGINVGTTNATRVGNISNIEIKNAAATGVIGIRVNSSVAARVNLTNIAVSGYTTPFRDDTASRLAYDTNVSWAAESGVTASRPSVASATVRRDGRLYFDTTLGKPIWSKSSTWVDAAGTVV